MSTRDIKFTAGGHSQILGNFAPGDIARGLPESLARHFVEEAHAAKYLQPVMLAVPAEPVSGDLAKKRGRRPKASG